MGQGAKILFGASIPGARRADGGAEVVELNGKAFLGSEQRPNEILRLPKTGPSARHLSTQSLDALVRVRLGHDSLVRSLHTRAHQLGIHLRLSHHFAHGIAKSVDLSLAGRHRCI